MMVLVVMRGGAADGGRGTDCGDARHRGREGAEVVGRLLGVRPACSLVLYC